METPDTSSPRFKFRPVCMDGNDQAADVAYVLAGSKGKARNVSRWQVFLSDSSDLSDPSESPSPSDESHGSDESDSKPGPTTHHQNEKNDD